MASNMPLILIVDDIELNRAMLYEMFYNEYTAIEAANGLEAVSQLEKHGDRIAAVLLDVIMPEMDGFAVLEAMNERGWIKHIPVIMISADSSDSLVTKGYGLGVADYIGRPFNASIIKSRVANIIELSRHKVNLEKLVLQQTMRLGQTNQFMIDALSTIVEFRNGESGLHTRRICLVTKLLSMELSKKYKEYQLSALEIEEISNAAALHDIGKIAVPESILNKPGKLTDEEFEVIKMHPQCGAEILEKTEHIHDWSYFDYCYDICLLHHERWDGKGYPKGLKDNDIPVWSQVVSLADVYDALTSERVYKEAYTHEKALEMILNGECGVFNPKLLKCLREIADDMVKQLKEMEEQSRKFQCSNRYSEELQENTKSTLSSRTLHLLEVEREKYQAFASLSNEILFDYDFETDTVDFSERFYDTFSGEIHIEHFLENYENLNIMDEDSSKAFKEVIENIKPHNLTKHMELRMKTKSNNWEWFEIIIKTIWDEDRPGTCISCLGKITNINKEKLEKDILKEQACKDFLTGIFNRGETERRIKEIIQRRPITIGAFIFIDIDNFKAINDTKGHMFGDEVLRFISREILKNIRSTDVAGRIGGDEFVIFLDYVRDMEGIIKNVERISGIFKKGYQKGAEALLVSGSLGIATYPQDGTTYEELLRKADQALYSVKNTVKGAYAFFDYEIQDSKREPNFTKIESYIED